jgi:hypothetical protein
LRQVPWAPGSAVRGIDLANVVSAPGQKSAWDDFERILSEYWPKSDYAGDQWKRNGEKFQLWSDTRCELMGASFPLPSVDGRARPIVLTPTHPTISVPVGRRCARLHILGNVTCPDGYPPAGEAGAAAATLIVKYETGSDQKILLRHGYEVARSNLIYQTTRIDPIATRAQRALRYTKDTAREVYQVLLHSIPVHEPAVVSVSYELKPGEQPLFIFAISTEDPLTA